MKARSTTITITYKGKDISEDIAPFLTQFTFTDNSGDKSDDISFTLMDRDGLWLDDWFPSKGDIVTCSILVDDETAQSLPCGNYEVDQIDYSAPPQCMVIKAISTAITKGMKNEKHSKAWENVTLQAIAADIANDNGLALYYDGDEIQIERREQIDTSDIEFISGLCADYDLNVKVNEGKLIIYDGELNEQKDSVAEIDITDEKLLAWRFSSKAANIFKKAVVKYHNAAKDELLEGEEEDSSVEGTERVLYVHEYAESAADAKAKAKKKLAAANRKEVTGNITLMGDLRFRAGSNLTVTGFGKFSGKYTISKATHSIGSGYVTTLEMTQGSEAKKESKAKTKKKQSKKKSAMTESYYTGENYYRTTD